MRRIELVVEAPLAEEAARAVAAATGARVLTRARAGATGAEPPSDTEGAAAVVAAAVTSALGGLEASRVLAVVAPDGGVEVIPLLD
ncbi:hypothetical protein GB864_17785 [Agromyces sp. MMS17-SY077]|uniref:Uncharacterized protein n=1 Tax=Agromyces seonyuensis TaxID=2662446 RepID=A0A6I4P156_9MICO|nr:hypothetical protein [Agromyces seonyuensis]